MTKKPGAHQHSAVVAKPQLWVQREQAITQVDIMFHELLGMRCINDACNVDLIALKNCISLAGGEEELVLIVNPGERTMRYNLSRIVQVQDGMLIKMSHSMVQGCCAGCLDKGVMCIIFWLPPSHLDKIDFCCNQHAKCEVH